MNILCKLGLHKIKILKVEHYTDFSYGGRAKSSKVIYICDRKCGHVRVKGYYGVTLKLEDICEVK